MHLANFERLERHVDVFMGLLPERGDTVDLMPLFLRLVCDWTEWKIWNVWLMCGCIDSRYVERVHLRRSYWCTEESRVWEEVDRCFCVCVKRYGDTSDVDALQVSPSR